MLSVAMEIVKRYFVCSLAICDGKTGRKGMINLLSRS